MICQKAGVKLASTYWVQSHQSSFTLHQHVKLHLSPNFPSSSFLFPAPSASRKSSPRSLGDWGSFSSSDFSACNIIPQTGFPDYSYSCTAPCPRLSLFTSPCFLGSLFTIGKCAGITSTGDMQFAFTVWWHDGAFPAVTANDAPYFLGDAHSHPSGC